MTSTAAATGRMLYPHTQYVDGELCVGPAVPLRSIAEEHSTPTYVYDLGRIQTRYRELHTSFEQALRQSANDSTKPSSVSLHYSLKANPGCRIVRLLLDEGAGIDCVSAGEVAKAVHYGAPPERIVFAGVGKTPSEIRYAVSVGVGWFNVENELELDHIQQACAEASSEGKKTQISLRVNPNVVANTHPSISTGHGGAKFGLPVTTVKRLLLGEEARAYRASRFPNLLFAGLHVHIGSQLSDVAPSVEAVRIVSDIARQVPGLHSLNIGGGFPVQYHGGAAAEPAGPSPATFAEAIAPHVAGFHVMLEPGRFIVADAGVLLTKALYRKDQGESQFLIVDASMVEVMRPALYDAFHDVVPISECPVDPSDTQAVSCTVAGPVCESTDILNRRVWLTTEVAQPGALFAVMTAGAYCSSMAGNYNARPLCAEVVVDPTGAVQLARRRQTFDDLMREDVLG